MQLIDSHSHIDFSDFDSDRNAVIQRAVESGVSDIVVSSTTAGRWQLVKKICEENPYVCHAAYGLHPMFMHQHSLENRGNSDSSDTLRAWLRENKAIAIGEIGLDFFIDEADEKHRQAQLALFISQLEVASEFELPVIIHARKSLDIILKYLRQFPKVRGSIHSFSGSLQQAEQLTDLGYYLSFGGPITYSRATRLHKLIQAISLDALLVETDAPDQPDSNHHLERNEPAYLFNVVEKIADLKGVEKELVAEKTVKNTIELFNLGNI